MNRRLHVGMNLLWLVPGVVGGSEEYTVRLLAALRDLDPDDLDLTLFVTRSFVEPHRDLTNAFTTVICPISGTARPVRIAAESTWLVRQARHHGIDLLHHAGGTIPPIRATPTMVTVHDLQPLLYPEHFSRVKNAYLRWRLKPSVTKAKCVVTLTAYTAATITDRFHVPVELVPPGYSATADTPPSGDPRTKYDLTGPFFLYPAITYPHKNHAILVRAFAGVVAKRPDALLVLTHRPAQMEGEVQALIGELGLAGNVRRLGHIDRGDLNWLYANAVALTFPSRFEGFGMPVLEAMGHRCPVIAANSAALPSVVGEGGVLADPDDDAAWTAAMLELLTDDTRREQLAASALARVEREYQWQRSAERLHDLYRQVGTA